MDRRTNPSHGYRAVHVITSVSGKLIEIQVRTLLQHLWAELSEKFSDVYDQDIKYGGGEEGIRRELAVASKNLARLEEVEKNLNEQHQEKLGLQSEIAKTKGLTIEFWRGLISDLEKRKKGKP